jgi:hypothetical protein
MTAEIIALQVSQPPASFVFAEQVGKGVSLQKYAL